jgi:hypothetical protein
MSYAFITSLTQAPQQTYQQLLVSIRQILANKYSQKPQLSASHVGPFILLRQQLLLFLVVDDILTFCFLPIL